MELPWVQASAWYLLLAPLGVSITELPLSPDRLARLVRERGARA